jgi:hypothetical protein
MAQKTSGNVYEDQKNNGNRKTEDTDKNIGGAEKGGPGLSRAQSRMPPDADKEQHDNHDSPVEGSRDDLHFGEDRSK